MGRSLDEDRITIASTRTGFSADAKKPSGYAGRLATVCGENTDADTGLGYLAYVFELFKCGSHRPHAAR